MIRFALLAAAALALPGCAATTPAPTLANAEPFEGVAWTEATPLPAPEGDLAWVRGYARARGFSYTPQEEASALLQMMRYRIDQTGVPGFQQAWTDDGVLTVNMKPPYDRAALIALAAPEIRDRLVVRDVALDRRAIDRLQAELFAAVGELRGYESTAYFDHRKQRFDVAIVGEEAAEKLRAMLSSELAAVTDIRLSEGPLVVY